MRALVLGGPGRVDLAEVPEPGIRAPGDAVVRVERAGLCGSDLHPYEGREPAAPGVVAGHEAVGSVEAVGAAVGRFRPGDRVVVPFSTSCGGCEPCRRGLTARCVRGALFGWGPPDDPGSGLAGGQAELLRVPLADGTLVGWPDGLPADAAVLLTDNLPTAIEAVARAEPVGGERLAVVGCGSVGLCAVAAAVAGGMEVVAVDPVPERRRLAAGLGASPATPEQATGDAGTFASVVEAGGTASSQRLGFELVRPGGVLSVIAVQTGGAFGFGPVEAYDRNLRVRFGRASVRSTLGSAFASEAGRDRITGLASMLEGVVVTHPGLPLESGPAAYRTFSARAAGMVKATFAPGDRPPDARGARTQAQR